MEKNTCKGKDLLTECEAWCREYDLPDIIKGCLDATMIKNAVWAKNEKELKQMIADRPKIDDRYSEDRKDRDYRKQYKTYVTEGHTYLVQTTKSHDTQNKSK